MIKNWIMALAYPTVCPLCERVMPATMEGDACEACALIIPRSDAPCCYKCGKVLLAEESEYCVSCQSIKFHFKQGFIVFPYEKSIKEAILNFKYYGRKDLGLFFARQTIIRFEEQLRRIGADAFIPIPIHKSRLKKRGYNQAAVYAEELSKIINIPVINDLLIRIKHTKAQKNLGAIGRIVNLSDAFMVDLDVLAYYKKRITLNRVILVDDIFTTGSTIECSSVKLIEAGILEVYSVCISSPRFE